MTYFCQVGRKITRSWVYGLLVVYYPNVSCLFHRNCKLPLLIEFYLSVDLPVIQYLVTVHCWYWCVCMCVCGCLEVSDDVAFSFTQCHDC